MQVVCSGALFLLFIFTLLPCLIVRGIIKRGKELSRKKRKEIEELICEFSYPCLTVFLAVIQIF